MILMCRNLYKLPASAAHIITAICKSSQYSAAHYLEMRLHEIVFWMLPQDVLGMSSSIVCSIRAFTHSLMHIVRSQEQYHIHTVRSSLTMTAVRWQQLASPASAPGSPMLLGLEDKIGAGC